MATALSGLTSDTSLDGTESLAVEDAGTAKKIAVSDIAKLAHLGSMTFAQLIANYPAASTPVGVTATISEFGSVLMVNNGSYWKPAGGVVVVKCQAADITLSALTAEQIFTANQVTFPAGFLRVGCEIEVTETFAKSNAANVATLRHRLGSAGTTSDAQVSSTVTLGNGFLSYGRFLAFKVIAATTLRYGGGNDPDYPFAIVAVTTPTDITISNISGALTLSPSVQMSTTTGTITSRTLNVKVVFP